MVIAQQSRSGSCVLTCVSPSFLVVSTGEIGAQLLYLSSDDDSPPEYPLNLTTTSRGSYGGGASSAYTNSHGENKKKKKEEVPSIELANFDWIV